MDIDLPDVAAEVQAAFEAYERALVSNDVDALNAMFRDDPRTIRFGGTENLFGYGEINAFRFQPARRRDGARRSRQRVRPARLLPRPSPAPSSPSRRVWPARCRRSRISCTPFGAVRKMTGRKALGA
jgi:Protein of unknown function (DUF3225)